MKNLLIFSTIAFSLSIYASERKCKVFEEQNENEFIIKAQCPDRYVKCSQPKSSKNLKGMEQFKGVSCSITENGKTENLTGEKNIECFVGLHIASAIEQFKKLRDANQHRLSELEKKK